VVAGLLVVLLRVKLRQQQLEPTPLFDALSALLMALGAGLPWLLVTGRARWRHRRG
jgi:uncharacterized membrane protein